MSIDEYYNKKIREKTGLSLKEINSLHSTTIHEKIKKTVKLKNEPLPHRYIYLEGKRGTSEHHLYKYYTDREKNKMKHLFTEYSK